MAKHKILVSRVEHTPAGFLVFNAGETKEVPAELVESFRADGNIGRGPLDRDGNGEDGGSRPAEPPALAGANKTRLLEIAKAEGVEVPEGATNAQIADAIEAKRAAAPDAGAPTE